VRLNRKPPGDSIAPHNGQFADARLATGMAGDDAEQSKPGWVGQRLELDR
jgi:hypothetical protein